MFSELTERIKELEGIVSCKITGKDQIDEIHVIASKDRDPKKIVRDIETMVLVNLNQKIDHKKISIAQVNRMDKTMIENRIEIISIYRENNRPICHLRLSVNNELIEEEVKGSIEEPIALIVAKAMIDTIEKYTNFNGIIRVENVFTTGINDEIIIVQLIVYKNAKISEQERLVGAAYIYQDLLLATGKACLKALNRRLNNYM